MVSTSQSREAVDALRSRDRDVAQACRMVGIHRSTYRYRSHVRSDEPRLRKRLHELADKYPPYGYRRARKLLLRDGWRVNEKRVQRLRSLDHLQVPRKRSRKRIRRDQPWPERGKTRNHVWTLDFVFDRTFDGRPVKILSLLDEYTRLCLALHAGRSLIGADVVRVLDRAAREHGLPAFLRADNGPEFVGMALTEWTLDRKNEINFIQPGRPWQNGCVESFHDKLRKECLNRECFLSLAEARVVLESWRREYNEFRPHSSLGDMTPAEFAACPGGPDSATLRPPLLGNPLQPPIVT